MKSQSKRKKKLLTAAAALALIAAISGTFAWITSQDQRINRASTASAANDTTKIHEIYDPIPLLPGTSTKKEVAVKNEGTMNTLVRVSYEEVLKHLAKKGEEKYDPDTVAGAKYTYVADDPGINKHMPVSYDANEVANGFTKVPAAQINGGTALPTNVELYTKKGIITNPVDGTEINEAEQILVHQYEPGLYQKMTYTCELDVANGGYNSDKTDSTKWSFDVTDLKYGYYENGFTHTVVNWAASSLAPKDAATPTVDGNAVLGYKGERYGVKYDYTPATLGITIPGVTSPTFGANADKIPDLPTPVGKRGVMADENGLGTDEIKIGYSDHITNIAGLTAATESWVYNEDDGWFYYTDVLEPGDTTKNLLERLIFENLGKEYTNASYDLVVKMEAIQATPEALEDATTGWGLSSTGDTGAILTKLKAGL